MEKWLYIFKRKRHKRVNDSYEHRSKIVLTSNSAELENSAKRYWTGKLNVADDFSYHEFESLKDMRQYLLLYNPYSALQFLVEFSATPTVATSPTLF